MLSLSYTLRITLIAAARVVVEVARPLLPLVLRLTH